MSSAAGTEPSTLKHFRSPSTVIGRFVARRTVRSALLWALVFGGYVASKAIGFADLYPNAAARIKIAQTFGSNVGIEVLLGKAPEAATTGAYVAWNTGGIMVVIGAIWALLLATRYFRGEEDSGRWEELLSGQTTARQAAINALCGLAASLTAFYVIMAGLFVMVGKAHGVDFGVSASLYFALVVILGVTLFLSIGALASQLMPTRSRAASLSAIILGACFFIRVIGDITSMRWLLNVTPLGWVEKSQPLANSQPLWLVPFIVLIVVIAAATIFFAGHRDLGESIIADKPSAKPKLRLLGSPFSANARLNRSASLGWLSAIFIMALLFGLITKSTAQAFSQSASFQKVINRLAEQTRLSSALAYLGIVFFLQMVIIMAYAASSISSVRRDEAEGYIDNFLVRPVGRLRWLTGRVIMTGMVIVLAGLLTTLGVWIGLAGQHLNIPLRTLLLASTNVLVPSLLTIGVGICAFGIRPRLTSLLAYGVLAWSFLVETVSSGLNLNHWILDTSVLHQIVLAPAVNPRWMTDLIVSLLALAFGIIGAVSFNNRDLENE